jgi:ParB family chromosome partitioning protein
MGLSLGALSDEIEEARRLRETIGVADQVAEIDPAKIERSPFSDRLSEGARMDETFAALKESIRERGQQVPVLVRVHPDPAKAGQGLFQTAYGHRRVLAARELGLPVRAIVKALSDDDLVIAQGKENAERRDLSFIERALFANALVEHGFDRATAMAALGVDKTEMSRADPGGRDHSDGCRPQNRPGSKGRPAALARAWRIAAAGGGNHEGVGRDR